MMPEEEKEWIELMNVIHDSVKGGMKYNTGTLLMVLSRPVGAQNAPVAVSSGAGELKLQSKSESASKLFSILRDSTPPNIQALQGTRFWWHPDRVHDQKNLIVQKLR